MALSTYYDPKSSSYTTMWDPKKKDSQDPDAWLAENMGFLQASTAEERRKRSGISLNQGTEGFAAWNDRNFDDAQIGDSNYTRAKRVEQEQGLGLTAEEQAHWDELQKYEAETVKAAALKGAATGGVGGAWGAAIGAGGAALNAGNSSYVGYAEAQIAEEEAERVARMQADAGRLSQEASVANQRLGGAPGATQDPLAANYATPSPTGYDDWYNQLFA